MVYSCKNAQFRIAEKRTEFPIQSHIEVNMTEVPIVYGPLSSFIDRDDTVDLELSCLSQMSVTIIFFPNFKIQSVLFKFIQDLFGLEKADIDEKNMNTR
jgi:hypothetical protein